jgi:nuclear pore complex protein Nup133
MANGVLIGVQFGDAVVICGRGKFTTGVSGLLLILSESDYSDRLELKSSSDRTIGAAVVASDNQMLILTASLMMKAAVDVIEVLSFNPESVISCVLLSKPKSF